ncbi:hypothetical protein MYXO_02148 [Myxococcaceae bacterium]|nr:hypothetical protein MYXO_02148 [Myxococcaceae bacterium]
MPPAETARSEAGPPTDADALPAAEQARGRRLALSSHPFQMTFRRLFSEDLPTLALVSLGAGDAAVGLQRAFEPLSALLQLPALRALRRMSKRRLLLIGQVVSLVGGLPLVFFATLADLGPETRVAAALGALALASVGFGLAETPWFPLLYGYVPSDRIGRFFGTLRSTWHLALIVSYLGAQQWLARHPGSFGPLFAFGWACGFVRVGFALRFPDRSTGGGPTVRARDGMRALAGSPELRRYFVGVSLCGGARRAITPFAIVVMRRVIGMSEAQVLVATVASFAGGLLALYAAGRLADRLGSAPVFRWSALGLAALSLGLCGLREPGTTSVAIAAALFCGIAALSAAFGVADTNVLFSLAPAANPAPVLTAAAASTAVSYAAAPLLAGAALEIALSNGVDELLAYRALFVVAAIVFAVSWIPLRGFRDPESAPDEAPPSTV